jgi:hypothetical protein
VVLPEAEAIIPELKFTVMLAVSAQLPEETITEYVVAAVGVTEIAAVVAPVLQE